jgi:hypothetical protein
MPGKAQKAGRLDAEGEMPLKEKNA